MLRHPPAPQPAQASPPAWIDGGSTEHLLGTDEQGRDVLSAVMFGTQVSLIVGFMSVLFSVVLGVGLGLISGYVGGRTDHIIMRIADVQLSFPAVLVAPSVGDRGDVKARGFWRNGEWTVEFARRLSTGSPFDIAFRGELYLGVAPFDNAESKHAYHLKPIRLVIEQTR